MVRSVRLIFVNWNMMSRIEGFPTLLLLALKVAGDYLSLAQAEMSFFPGCASGSWICFVKYKYLKS